jgi:hypothetical protein
MYKEVTPPLRAALSHHLEELEKEGISPLHFKIRPQHEGPDNSLFLRVEVGIIDAGTLKTIDVGYSPKDFGYPTAFKLYEGVQKVLAEERVLTQLNPKD